MKFSLIHCISSCGGKCGCRQKCQNNGKSEDAATYFICLMSDVYCKIASLQYVCFCYNSIACCCWLAARSLWAFHLVVSVCCYRIPSRAGIFAWLVCSSELNSATSDVQLCTGKCRTSSSCVPWSVVGFAATIEKFKQLSGNIIQMDVMVGNVIYYSYNKFCLLSLLVETGNLRHHTVPQSRLPLWWSFFKQ